MRFLVALALLFSIAPGVSEVLEVAVHLIGHADLPHHDTDEDRGCSEHACTPLSHHCSCHQTMSAQATTQPASTRSVYDMTQLDPCAIATTSSRAAEPPPLRPPIA